MLTDKELEKLAQPIIQIFNDMEIDLIMEVASRFDTYETIGGTLEWQLKMLEKMGVLNADCVKVIANYSKRTEKEINEMLKKASMANFSEEEMNKAFEEDLLRVNFDMAMNSKQLKDVIRLTKIETKDAVKLIQTKCLESVRQDYMDVVNTAYVETSSGLRSYNESIVRALKKYAQKGITGATYKRIDKDGNEKIVNYSLEGVVRRDIVTATNQLANKSSIEYAKDFGYEYVEVSQHLGARTGDGKENYTNHAWWQGKVYKVQGSEPKYPNLVEVTGYGDIRGLGGVNCRHRTFPFIPGISKPQPLLDYNKVKQQYDVEQGLRKLERKMRMLRREYVVMKQCGEKEKAKELQSDIKILYNQIEEYCKKYNIKRDESREVVKENL